jgi:preprotein translocase subunit SecG
VNVLFQILMLLVAVFLILLVLVQRGRGGGLAGAFGGMGGQSAFGTKAGDLFTKITVGAALVWILLACVAVKYFSAGRQFDANLGAQAPLASPAGEVAAPAQESDSGPASGADGATGSAERPEAPTK